MTISVEYITSQTLKVTYDPPFAQVNTIPCGLNEMSLTCIKDPSQQHIYYGF